MSPHAHGSGHAAGDHGRLTSRAALASVAMAMLLLGAKGWAAAVTGSVAMLGSLADTALDLMASVVTLFAVRLAAAPADHDHRFGHGKAEAIAALFQTMLILASAAGIGWEAAQRLSAPVATHAPATGIAVSALAAAATFALISYQARVIRATGSLAIGADRLHYQADLLMNLAVIGAFALEAYAGVHGTDAVSGIAIALYLAASAMLSARGSVDMLMDKEWPEARRQAVLRAAAAVPGVEGVHDLRTRSSATAEFAQLSVWLPAELSVTRAHDIVCAVETAVDGVVPGARVFVHVDPSGHYDAGALRI